CGRKSNERDGDPYYCHLSGLDPNGKVTWERTMEGSGTESSLNQFSEVEAEKHRAPVPAASLFLDDSDAAGLIMIDPATGDNIGNFPAPEAAAPRAVEVHGDRLLVTTSAREDCRLAGYSLTDGSRLWRAELACSRVVSPFWVNDNSGHAFLKLNES